jgi:outer membrane protein, multidrug efflux system
MIGRSLAAIALACLLSGCKVGPDYVQPPTNVPTAFRGVDAKTAQSLGDLKWAEVFADPQLQSLIAEALVKNFDVRIAVQHVLEARAQLAGAKGNQNPTLGATAQGQYERTLSGVHNPPYFDAWEKSFGVQLSYEVDLWGRLARSTEAARAQFLASEAARQAVLTTIVSSVASGYLQLLELDLELQVTRETLAARQDSLRLTQIRLQGGVASLQDVRQAETLVDGSLAAVPQIQRQIEQTENVLSLLLGRYPGPIPRGLPLLQQLNLPDAPPGIPANLLERRPDIRQAEQSLLAANAQIGTAKGLLLPTFQITGSSAVVNTLLSGIGSLGTAGIFALLGAANQLIFDGGRVRSGVAFAEAQKDEAVAVYQRTVVTGVREVSDALADYRFGIQTVRQQQALAAAVRDSLRLANLRYTSGLTSYLEVLNAQTQSYDAEIGLARAELAERNGIISLYKALGGGWQ